MNADEKTPTPDMEPALKSDVQGEGDYKSTRRYREDTERFLKGADVTELARRAAPKSKEEEAELQRAEEIGRSHSAKK